MKTSIPISSTTQWFVIRSIEPFEQPLYSINSFRDGDGERERERERERDGWMDGEKEKERRMMRNCAVSPKKKE